jgi:MoaA/NifB/PqqE/SkfB family radical SAM enzyme
MSNNLLCHYLIKSLKYSNYSERARRIKRIILSKKAFRAKINYIITNIQYIIKNIHVVGYPYKITIDPINFCNLQCALCPTGNRLPGRTRSYMAFSTFKKIIDELSPYLLEIDLYNWGEPLLNKDIFRMIEYARSYNIDVDISTNLNYFNDEICANLISSGLNKLIISLDGASQLSVEKYQKGNNFESVIKHIKQLIERKERLKCHTPYI